MALFALLLGESETASTPPIWGFKGRHITPSVPRAQSLVVDSSRNALYFGGGSLYSLDVTNGSLMWMYVDPDPTRSVSGVITMDKVTGVIFATSATLFSTPQTQHCSHRFSAVNCSTGSELWSADNGIASLSNDLIHPELMLVDALSAIAVDGVTGTICFKARSVEFKWHLELRQFLWCSKQRQRPNEVAVSGFRGFENRDNH